MGGNPRGGVGLGGSHKGAGTGLPLGGHVRPSALSSARVATVQKQLGARSGKSDAPGLAGGPAPGMWHSFWPEYIPLGRTPSPRSRKKFFLWSEHSPLAHMGAGQGGPAGAGASQQCRGLGPS